MLSTTTMQTGTRSTCGLKAAHPHISISGGRSTTARTARPSVITAQTTGVLRFYPDAPTKRVRGKVYPIMRGELAIGHSRVLVLGYLEQTVDGRKYLSLNVGAPGYKPVGGSLFRAETQDMAGVWSAVPGKEFERYGTIGTQEAVSNDPTAFMLCFMGKCRLTPSGTPYIRASVYAQDAQPLGDDYRDSVAPSDYLECA